MRISDWSSDVCSSVLIVRLMTIQRYGIYNPFTGNGAIKGLMPHGPHNIRDVLATHILKQTGRSEEHTSELQSLMRISYAVFCLKKKKNTTTTQHTVVT